MRRKTRMLILCAAALPWAGACLPDDEVAVLGLFDQFIQLAGPVAEEISAPVLPPKVYSSSGFFPYARNDSKYATYMMLTNRSDYSARITVDYFDLAGNQAGHEQWYLGPWQCKRWSKAGFCGTIDYTAEGDEDAVSATIEMRSKKGQGIALSQPACQLPSVGVNWYYEFCVTDQGPGKTRTVLATCNLRSDIPIYVEYTVPAGGSCGESIEVKIPPHGVHAFCPFDSFQNALPNGLVNKPVYVAARTGPNRSGQPVSDCSGVRLIEEPNGQVALIGYTEQLPLYWDTTSYCDGKESVFLLDVHDNGSTRTDRILVKRNGSVSLFWNTYKLYFYDSQGNLVKPATAWPNNLPTFKLADSFSDTGSSAALSPKQLLGKSFSGSVVIESPCDIHAMVLHRSPGGAIDICGDAPGRDGRLPGRTGLVSSLDPNYRYHLQLFLPDELIASAGASTSPAAQWGQPSQTPPAASAQCMVLKFHNADGTCRGWLALRLKPHETRNISIDDVAQKYMSGGFEGWVIVEPIIPARVLVESRTGSASGSAGIWCSGQP